MFDKLMDKADCAFRTIFGVESKEDANVIAVKIESNHYAKMRKAIDSTDDEYIKDQLRMRLANNIYEYKDLVQIDNEIDNQDDTENEVTV